MCFKSALRLHYIPLCLLENHYSAIKNNGVPKTHTEFPSVSEGCAFPSCLSWSSPLAMVKENQLSEKHSTGGRSGWCFILFFWFSDNQAPTSIMLVCNWLFFKQHGSGMFRDKFIFLQKWREMKVPLRKKMWNMTPKRIVLGKFLTTVL